MRRARYPSSSCVWGCRLKIGLLLIVVTMAGAGLGYAQSGEPDGTADYILNMRAGPSVDHAVIAVLEPGTGLVLEARDAETAWVLGHTGDGSQRGWVAALYLSYRDGFTPVRLPESGEIVAAPAPAVPVAGTEGDPPPQAAVFEPLASGPLGQVPVIPAIGPRAAQIFAHGQALGNDARVFTQVGECNTESQAFMVPFAAGTYNLGPYAHLQPTIDFFQAHVMGRGNSFWYKGVTLTTGMTSSAVIDPMLSNPSICGEGVSLLACEYARSKPAVALINLGLYDVYWLTPDQYAAAMREIVQVSITQGVIPVLFTFPTHAGETSNWPNDAATRDANRVAFNQIVVQLGYEYGIPVVNFWRAAEALVWHGLRANDYQHLLEPPMIGGRYRAWFTGDETQYGFSLYNLVALQTLDVLRAQVLGGG